MDVSQQVYEMFEADRQAARDAVRVETNRREVYDGDVVHEQARIFNNWKVVYRSPEAGPRDWLRTIGAIQWPPVPPNWRRVCSAKSASNRRDW